MTKTLLITAAALVLCSGSCLAYGSGTDGAQFMSINPGVISSGMGGSGMATGMGGESIFLNPASLYLSFNKKQVIYSHINWFEDVSCEYVSYLQGIKKIGVFGIGWTYLHLPDIIITNRFGIPDSQAGSANVSDNLFCLSYANRLGKNIFIGTNLKGVLRVLDSVAAPGLAMDLGFLYYGRQRSGGGTGDYYDLSGGIMIRNLLATRICFNDYSNADKILPVLKAGLGYKPLKEITLALDLDVRTDRTVIFHLGAGFRVSKNIELRAGYESNDDLGESSGLCAGFSFFPSKKLTYTYGQDSKTTAFDFQVDYAMRFSGEMGLVHRVATKMNFEGRKGARKRKEKAESSNGN